MKKLSIAIALWMAFIGIVAFTAEKKLTVTFTEATLNKHWYKLNAVKQILNESALPHNQVTFAISSIDSLQMEIATQVRPQLVDSLKK